jgi:hypothetical protein
VAKISQRNMPESNPVNYRIVVTDYRYSSTNNAIARNRLQRVQNEIEYAKIPGNKGFLADLWACLITSRSQVQILSPQLNVSTADSRLCNPAKSSPERLKRS